MNYIGLDIGKDCIVLCVLMPDNHCVYSDFENNASGIQSLIQFIKPFEVIHVCCEYTGIYYLNIAKALYQAGYAMSVINPYAIKNYAKQKLRRIKTDKEDALLIAEYGQKFNPELWKPATDEMQILNGLIARIEQLNKVRISEKNREKVSSGSALKSIQEMICFIEQQINILEKEIENVIALSFDLKERRDLIKSIPGIGDKTANILLPLLSKIEQFPNAKRMVSYLGLSPVIYQSGTSVHWKSHISKMGNSFIRKSLFFPARVCCLRSKIFKDWTQRHLERGKAPKVVYTMMMRKLVVYAYTVVKTGKPFSKELLRERLK